MADEAIFEILFFLVGFLKEGLEGGNPVGVSIVAGLGKIGETGPEAEVRVSPPVDTTFYAAFLEEGTQKMYFRHFALPPMVVYFFITFFSIFIKYREG